jgi:hypothetical protein
VRAGKRLGVGAGVLVAIAACWSIQRASTAGEPVRSAPARALGRSSPPADEAALARRLDSILDGEDRDVEWAHASEQRIGAFLASDRARGASVRRIDCRSSLCRVAVTCDSVETRVRLFHELGRLTPSQLVYFFYVETATPLSSIAYLPREGHPLPLDAPSS